MMPTLLWYRCNFKSFRDVVNEARALFWKLAGLELCMRLRKTVFYSEVPNASYQGHCYGTCSVKRHSEIGVADHHFVRLDDHFSASAVRLLYFLELRSRCGTVDPESATVP
ncbi:hypothetical protein V6N12_021944 [Hibiscus sabdariffa]|uniref:Uncharacterized protein n=1 Tax=Hibiscus sabdariffa TaxID=183260 RepID=A0ABR2FT70_9ROSI